MSDHMMIVLQAAVPLWIAELQKLNGESRWQQARQWRDRAVDGVAERGDVLQYGGGKKGQAAATFNDTARGLAVLALAPGGVFFYGIHWCLDHQVGIRCESIADLTCATSGFGDDPASSPRREVVTVYAAGGVL